MMMLQGELTRDEKLPEASLPHPAGGVVDDLDASAAAAGLPLDSLEDLLALLYRSRKQPRQAQYLQDLRAAMPRDIAACLHIAAHDCEREEQRLLLLFSLAFGASAAELWIHYNLALLLGAIEARGVAAAREPCLIHCYAALPLCGGAPNAALVINDILARLLEQSLPVASIRHGFQALALGNIRSKQSIWAAARTLRLTEAVTAEALRIPGLMQIAAALAVPYLDAQPAFAMSPPVRHVAPPTVMPAPLEPSASRHAIFRRSGQSETFPAVDTYVLRNGAISVNLAWRGFSEFYVFDGDGALVEALSHGYQPFRKPVERHVAGALAVIDDKFVTMNVAHLWLDKLPRTRLFAPEARRQFLLFVDHPYYREAAALLGLDALVLPQSPRFTISADELHVPSILSRDMRHPAHGFPPWAMEFFHGLRQLRPAENARPKRRIYVSRQDAPARHILNQSEIDDVLRPHGYEFVTLAGMSLAEQVALFAEVEIVAGIHGAGLVNIVFARQPVTLVEILPPLAATAAYWLTAHALGHRYLSVVGRDPSINVGDYRRWGHHPEYAGRNFFVSPREVDDALLAAGR